MMLTAYKYRVCPNDAQREMFLKHYETDKTSLSCYDLNGLLPDLKNDVEWLKEVNSQSLQQTQKRLDSAFKRFFREKNGFPKFKSRKNPVQSFQLPQNYIVDFVG
jgi:putative transposase